MTGVNQMTTRGAILALDRANPEIGRLQPDESSLTVDIDMLERAGLSEGMHSSGPYVEMFRSKTNNANNLQEFLRGYDRSQIDFSVLLREPTEKELERFGQESLRGIGNSAMRAVELVKVQTEEWPCKILTTGQVQLATINV